MKIGFFTILLILYSLRLAAQCEPPTGPDSPGAEDTAGAVSSGMDVVVPSDPNEIISPEGYDSARWVSILDNMPFTILYENDPKLATAPANDVTIYYPISVNQDISSFRLGSFGFNDTVFTIPPGRAYYYTRLDLVAQRGIYVDVTAGVDLPNNRAFWILQTIDPLTGQSPTDPFKGFLPIYDTTAAAINDSVPPDGQGFVTFYMKPAPASQTRDTIFSTAEIIFDSEGSIMTNTEYNTIDALPPSSSVSVLSFNKDSVQLNFSGSDDAGGSGIRGYDLYVAQDSASFNLFQANINDTIFVFTGQPGSTFRFLSIATDNTGNRENGKSSPDDSVTLEQAPANLMVRCYIEGFYRGGGFMASPLFNAGLVTDSTLSDSVTVELHETTSPFDLIYETTGILKNNGRVEVKLPYSEVNKSYYITLRHRNAMETWTSNPVAFSLNTSYDFSSSASMAYGNNQTQVDAGVFAIYSGDLNPQDGVMDLFDQVVLDNDVVSFAGGYIVTDLNGDGSVDLFDQVIMDNNILNFICVVRP